MTMTLIRKAAITALLVALSIGLSGCSYNRFVSQEEAIKAQWAQVENQLQRRNDLIPNLVESTKGFAQQERDVFNAIADSRAKLAGAQTKIEGDLVTAPVNDAALMPAVVRRLEDAGIAVGELALRRSSLDEVFLALTGHRARPEDGAPEAGSGEEEFEQTGSRS